MGGIKGVRKGQPKAATREKISEANSKHWEVVHPAGKVEVIHGLSRFAMDHRLNYGNLVRTLFHGGKRTVGGGYWVKRKIDDKEIKLKERQAYMERTFGDEWKKCITEGRCWIVQDTIFNPYDGQGLDLYCHVHGRKFNISTQRGEWNIPTPSVCPDGAKNKLN